MRRHAPSLGLGLGLSLRSYGIGFRGLLDLYPGASAAYSLRALSSNWLAGDVVEVRRSSDSTSQGFTASQITSGAMLSFVNAGTTDLYNSARYFNGTSTTVTLGSTVTMAGDFSISLSHLYVGTGATQDIIGDNTINSRFGYSTGLSAYFISTTSGTLTFTGSMPNEGEINVIEINRVGTTVTLTLNGNDYTETLGGTLNINRISSFSALNYSKGFTYAINLNGQAAYTGLGTSVTAWEDTIGSNDGTESNGAAYTGQPYDGFVSTWYDQSGNANDATQATVTSQPKIVSAGALVTGGLDFDGVDDYLDIISVSGLSGKSQSFFTLWSANENRSADRAVVIGTDGGSAGTHRSATAERFLRFQLSKQDFTANPLTSASINSIIGAGTASTVDDYTWHSNGLQLTPVTTSGAAVVDIDASNVGIGGNSSLSGTLNGEIQEIIIYNTDQSANREGIETNINDHYNIYTPSNPSQFPMTLPLTLS